MSFRFSFAGLGGAAVVAVLMASALVGTGCRTAAAPSPAAPVSGVATTTVPPASVPAPRPPTPPRTSDECRACRGAWGRHGLSETPSCNCRTNDGGKTCRDGADCEGICLADSQDPRREVTDPGPPPRGFFVGQCSELVSVFGCYRPIDRGAAAHGPAALGEPPGLICAD